MRKWWPVVFLAACGTETGNPEADAQLAFAYNARSSDPGTVAVGDAQGGASVDAVWLRLDAVELASDCTAGPEHTFDALGWTDHSGVDAVVQEDWVPDIAYGCVRTAFRVAIEPGDDEVPEFLGAAMAVSGTLADGRTFRVVVDDDVPLDLALAGESVTDDTPWLLSFDVAAWLDIPALEALPEDPVVVDADTHPDLLQAVSDRLTQGTQLHLDADGDGTVGPADTRLD